MPKSKRDFFDYLIDKLSSCNRFVVILISTFVSTFLSVPLVYIFVLLFKCEYNYVYFSLSIILPLLITPFMTYFILKLVKNLKFVKEHLQEEINKNKKKDIMLFEQARFALMGEMMANISHQWKQPLNTISLAVVAARTSSGKKEEMDKYFTIMEDNVDYLASTVDDFMSFFDKKVSLELRELEELIKEIKSIICSHIDNKKISLEIKIDEQSRHAMMVSSVTQVILNLLNNSRNALELLKKEGKKIELRFSSQDEGIIIECIDNGGGIEESIQHKIFDPYFTTKHKKKGTGIGLFMSKEIVQKVFEGDIILKSSDAEGTHFYIFIPYSDHCIKGTAS
ncbi:HAMP domain-containing sensor histidine kinase [Sulfurimonas sp. HSL-1716]|uniref:HAMP domain-containing sensor histidine kinase n=1 Tax=Hydrocurvibacter sulfurireducens TaxID=3131937 RepID=UPI0031FA3619